jgi:hypothetical protein
MADSKGWTDSVRPLMKMIPLAVGGIGLAGAGGLLAGTELGAAAGFPASGSIFSGVGAAGAGAGTGALPFDTGVGGFFGSQPAIDASLAGLDTGFVPGSIAGAEIGFTAPAAGWFDAANTLPTLSTAAFTGPSTPTVPETPGLLDTLTDKLTDPETIAKLLGGLLGDSGTGGGMGGGMGGGGGGGPIFQPYKAPVLPQFNPGMADNAIGNFVASLSHQRPQPRQRSLLDF